MNQLQQFFERSLNSFFTPEVFITQYFSKKCKNLGITLSKKQTKNMEKQFSDIKTDSISISIDISTRQIKNAGFKSEDKLKIILQDVFNDSFPEMTNIIEDFTENLPTIIEDFINNISDLMYSDFIKESKKTLTATFKDKKIFESDLKILWFEVFKNLRLLYILSIEVGSEYNYQLEDDDPATIEIISKLHARACQVSSEIITLLESGFADGANARWRTLHEITVTLIFIIENCKNSDLTARYFSHEGIESYKAAVNYQEHYEVLGLEPLSKEEIDELNTNYQNLIAKYGHAYKNSYGWASEIIGKDKPTFYDIEKHVNLNYLRPFYKLASYNVHANPKSMFFNLGLLPETSDIILAGPSNIGLSDPAQLTALSLLQSTTYIITRKPNIDGLVLCKIMQKYQEDLKNIIVEIEKVFI